MPAAPPRARTGGPVRRTPAVSRSPQNRSTLRRRTVRAFADHRKRLRVGYVFLVLVLVVAGIRLVTVQTVQSAELVEAASRQRTVELTLPAERGAILDAAGSPLAFSVEARALIANPRQIARDAENRGVAPADRVQEMVTAIAAATGDDPVVLTEQLSADRGYVVLDDDVDPDIARSLREQFTGLSTEYREQRRYPGGSLASNIVGYSRWSADAERLTGRAALESGRDNLLAGSEGLRVVDQAEGSSAEIPGSTQYERPVVPGSDLQLTLDSDLQYTVQRALIDEVQRTGAGPSSSAVVLDAATGEVRAMANGVEYDPNVPADVTDVQRGNPAVTDPYEPGSVNKVVTMAAALEYGLATPDEVLSVPGSIRVADATISDAWDHDTEQMTLTGVLARSSNVGTLMAAQRVGEERFADMLGRFGVGQPTGIELPGESAGQLRPRETWSGSTFGNLPIGQGLSMTTMQMAGMYQTVANDGVRIPPRIVQATIGPDGVATPGAAAEPVQVVSPETAAQLRTMLTAVTQNPEGDRNQRGTGYQAAIPGYEVAGKTGTAQQIDRACGCYSRSSYWITFAGMFPAQDPRYVVAIMLDAPAAGTHASSLFHDVAGYLAQREQLPVSAEPAPTQTLIIR